MTTSTTTTAKTPLEAHDVEIHWYVWRASDERDFIHWHGKVDLIEDEEQQVASISAYFMPYAAFNGSTFVDLDSESGDLGLVAGAVCGPGGVLREDVWDTYGREGRDSGLLIIDRVEFAPAVRGRGLLRMVLANLAYVCQGVGVIATYPSPISSDLPDDERKVARKRLAAHWADQGFTKLPGGGGVYVTDPDVLLPEGDIW